MGLAVKHRQLACQVGGFADDQKKNSMASPDNSDFVLPKGTIITLGSWVLVADGSGEFDSHLVDPDAPGTSEPTRCRATEEFVNHLDENPLPDNIKEIQKQLHNLAITYSGTELLNTKTRPNLPQATWIVPATPESKALDFSMQDSSQSSRSTSSSRQ